MLSGMTSKCREKEAGGKDWDLVRLLAHSSAT
jgi:hypothetical protein